MTIEQQLAELENNLVQRLEITISSRFEVVIDQKLSPIYALLTYHSLKFEQIETRLDKIETRLDKVETDLKAIQVTLGGHTRLLEHHNGMLASDTLAIHHLQNRLNP